MIAFVIGCVFVLVKISMSNSELRRHRVSVAYLNALTAGIENYNYIHKHLPTNSAQISEAIGRGSSNILSSAKPDFVAILSTQVPFAGAITGSCIMATHSPADFPASGRGHWLFILLSNRSSRVWVSEEQLDIRIKEQLRKPIRNKDSKGIDHQ